MKKAGLTWCVGALDFSVNEHEAGAYEPHWSVHLHAFSAVSDPKQTSRRLSQALPRSNAVHRPVKVQVWDGRRARGRLRVQNVCRAARCNRSGDAFPAQRANTSSHPVDEGGAPSSGGVA